MLQRYDGIPVIRLIAIVELSLDLLLIKLHFTPVKHLDLTGLKI